METITVSIMLGILICAVGCVRAKERRSRNLSALLGIILTLALGVVTIFLTSA